MASSLATGLEIKRVLATQVLLPFPILSQFCLRNQGITATIYRIYHIITLIGLLIRRPIGTQKYYTVNCCSIICSYLVEKWRLQSPKMFGNRGKSKDIQICEYLMSTFALVDCFQVGSAVELKYAWLLIGIINCFVSFLLFTV